MAPKNQGHRRKTFKKKATKPKLSLTDAKKDKPQVAKVLSE